MTKSIYIFLLMLTQTLFAQTDQDNLKDPTLKQEAVNYLVYKLGAPVVNEYLIPGKVQPKEDEFVTFELKKNVAVIKI